jgi:TonB-dependent starch-binding outer membrane protein SusC
LQQVFISVSATGNLAGTDENGEFSIEVPDLQAELIFDLPFYNKRVIFLNGRDYIEVSLVSAEYRSFDDTYNTPLGVQKLKDAVFPSTSLTADEIQLSKATSFDQTLKGKSTRNESDQSIRYARSKNFYEYSWHIFFVWLFRTLNVY